MKIADCLILDALKPFDPKQKCWPDKAGPIFFENLSFLEGDTTPDRAILYVSTYELLTKSNSITIDDCFVVCCGAPAGVLPFPVRCHVISLREDVSVFSVYNTLNQLFQKLWKWDTALNAALLSGSDAQTFIDLSEHLFSNPVVLLTDTLHVAAISQKIDVSHPDIQFMQENKYLPEHMVQQITSKPYLETSESFHTIGFYYPPNYINCTIVIRKYDQNPWHLNIICMYGVNVEPTDCDLVLLDTLGEYILAAAKHQPEINAQFNSRSSSFLYSLLADTVASEAELTVAASLLDLPLNDRYQLYVVSFPIPLESHSRYVLLNLEQLLPSSLKLIYHESILILDQISADGTSHEKYIMNALQLLLPINNAFCGISQVFSDLRLLRDVFHLARRTAEIGYRLNPDVVYYSFRDYYSYVLLSASAQSRTLPLLYIQQLDQLADYDRRHNSDNMVLLCKLLEHERSITDVSKEMHLHRNSVLYRVAKIEQILGMSLDDPDVRLHLLLSFKALNLLKRATELPKEGSTMEPDIGE